MVVCLRRQRWTARRRLAPAGSEPKRKPPHQGYPIALKLWIHLPRPCVPPSENRGVHRCAAWPQEPADSLRSSLSPQLSRDGLVCFSMATRYRLCVVFFFLVVLV